MSRTSLATIRINVLPIEILAHIFMLSKGYCFRNSRERLSLYNITAVCTHWRQLAINTPSLWAHIDIGPTTPTGLTRLLLQRTKGTPVHVHVYEPQPEVPSDLEYLRHGSRKVLPMLRPHIRWVCTLNIESYAYSTEFVGSVLNLWLDRGSTTLPRSLLVHRPFFNGLLSVDEPSPGTRVSRSKNAERVLLSINTLHLEGAMLPWDSNAYRGLVDLRLQFWRCEVSVSVSQIAGILSASPELAILRLAYLPLTRTKGWTQPAPILLGRLKLLDLVNTEPDSLELLLPLIALPSSPDDLSVAVPFDEQPQRALETFFSHSHMTTLYCYHPNYHLSPRLSLLQSLPCVRVALILKQLQLDARATEASPASFHPPTCSNIPNIILVSCEVVFEGLKVLIREHLVQNLRLQGCRPCESIGDSQSLEDMRNSLLEVYPDLDLSIEDEDSTYDLPVRQLWDEYHWCTL